MSRTLLLLAATATALYGNPEMTVELPGGASMDFVWIEPGTFTMGSDPSDRRAITAETPAHEVTITQGFWLGKHEVTQGQWECVMGTTPWSGRGRLVEDPHHPAVYISWTNVQELCARLNTVSGSAEYRLPTEAEWEYACRAGTTTLFSFGDDETLLDQYEWHAGNTRDVGLNYAQPIGLLRPNPWGLYDMHGNVSEWAQDWYGPYSSDADTDPRGPDTGSQHAIRGGTFQGFYGYSRSATRFPGTDAGAYWVGARLVRVGEAPSTSVSPASWGMVKEQAQPH